MATPSPPKRREPLVTDIVEKLRTFVAGGGPHQLVRIQRKCMGGCGRATAAAVIIKWRVQPDDPTAELAREETVVVQLCLRCLESARVVLT